MNSILQQTGFLFPIILAICALIGFLLCFRIVKRDSKKKGKSETAPKDKKTAIQRMQSLGIPVLFSLIIACTIWLAFAPEPAERSSAAPADIPVETAILSAAITTTPDEPESTSSEPKKTYAWLDELSPMIDKPKNFLLGSWSDGTEFTLDDRSYSHGLGMRICGTQFEEPVLAEDAPDNKDRHDCRQVSSEFALRSKYASLTFSVGADNGNATFFGLKEKNGVAQVVIFDSNSGAKLYDSGWVDYSFALYDKTISLMNVENITITFRTSGIPHKSPINRLQFVIVNPVLKLVED